MLTNARRDLSGRYKPLTMTAAYYTIGSLLTLLLDLSAEGFDIARVTQAISVFGPPYDVKLWGALIYAVVVATMFNFRCETLYCLLIGLSPLFCPGCCLALYLLPASPHPVLELLSF